MPDRVCSHWEQARLSGETDEGFCNLRLCNGAYCNRRRLSPVSSYAYALDPQLDRRSNAHAFIAQLLEDRYIDPSPMRVEANSINAFRPARGSNLTAFGFRVYAVLGYEHDDAMFKRGDAQPIADSAYGAVVTGATESVEARAPGRQRRPHSSSSPPLANCHFLQRTLTRLCIGTARTQHPNVSAASQSATKNRERDLLAWMWFRSLCSTPPHQQPADCAGSFFPAFQYACACGSCPRVKPSTPNSSSF